MELFTADGLPVGPAARFSSKSSSSPNLLPLTPSEGSQLTTLYRLFIRLHECGKDGGHQQQQQQQKQRTHSGGAGSTSGAGGLTADSDEAAATAAAPHAGLTLAESLAAVLKPDGDGCLETLRSARAAQQRMTLTVLGPGYQLTGTGEGNGSPLPLPHPQQLARAGAASPSPPTLEELARDLHLAGSRKAAWGQLTSAHGTSLSGSALPYPYLLLPARLLPHVSRIKGFPELVSSTHAEAGDAAAVALLNTNRSALLVDEIPIRCALSRPASGGATAREAASVATGEGGTDDGHPELPNPPPTRRPCLSHAAQLTVETTQRVWYCLPALAGAPATGVRGEVEFSCILLGCGVTQV